MQLNIPRRVLINYLQATITKSELERKVASRQSPTGDFPMESHTRASLLAKLSLGIGNPCDRAG